MKSKLKTGLMIILVAAFSSCVSSKKYKAATAEAENLTSQLSACNNTVSSANAKVADLNKQVTGLSGQVSGLKNQNAALAVDAGKYQAIKAEGKLSEAELNAALAARGTSMTEIQDKLVAGLGALLDSGIDVTYKNGLLFISLPEDLLFTSGSAALGKRAKEALSPLASVVNDYPKVQIYVIGNTDSKVIHTARFRDNWSLSTERANTIVRTLAGSYAVDPRRLLSAGRSKYSPIASNDSAEGRAKNRYTEIVLNPNLIELYELMADTGN
jgi:chemotaxis protein MotB